MRTERYCSIPVPAGISFTDNVLLESHKVVDLTLDSRLGKNLGGLLEGCRGKEGFGEKRSLRNSRRTGDEVAGRRSLSPASIRA